MSQPPAVGKPLSVRVDELLYDDLEAIMRTGVTASDAVRRAVEIVADIYRNAWSAGACPPGGEPDIASAVINVTSTYDSDPAVPDTGEGLCDSASDTGPAVSHASGVAVGQEGR